MSSQGPSDAYGQDPYAPQQPGYPGYGQQQPYTGYPAQAPRQPLDLAKVVYIGAWVVLALFGLRYFYSLTQDDQVPDFADRFFGGMADLATGMFYTGVLLAVALWMERRKSAV